jgi:OFA family oxalate/formate antiporter-like MFS transporter
MVGTGIGFGYLIPISVGSKWFPHQRGLVNGLAIGIFAAGSGVFGPIGGTLIEHIGWRSTFQVFAGVFFIFTMIGASMMKNPPEGYAGSAGAQAKAKAKVPDVTTAGVLKLPTFYMLWFAYALGTTAGTMVISQLVPFARGSGYDANAAKFALTIGAVGSAVGRFLSGWMSDHLGRLPTLRAVIMVSMVATPALYLLRTEIVLFYVFLFFVYYCYGTQLSVYTALAGDFWGTKYLSTNYGLLLLAWGFAGVMGPQFGARIFDATKSYQYAFFGAAILALGSLALLLTVKKPTPIAVVPPTPAMAGR